MKHFPIKYGLKHTQLFYQNVNRLNTWYHHPFSTNSVDKRKICVVGAGPAGFYATQHILKLMPNVQIDIIEKLPVPFGLVRFGVAPDHPEVKNVINKFTKTAENARVRFVGNLSLGKDVSLTELREHYHAVILSYGAEQDRTLNIPNEENNVFSAREFVAWYNGLPGTLNSEKIFAAIEAELRKCRTVSIIGQGNVAIDVARILLSPIDVLQKTDITDRALATLADSKIELVQLIGRRGPLQAAFTIKELREMLRLPNVITNWRPTDFDGIDENIVNNLPRPKKRIAELMLNSVRSFDEMKTSRKQFLPIFFRSPKSIEKTSTITKKLELIVNKMSNKTSAIPTEHTEILQSDFILRSIGYKGINVAQSNEFLNFDAVNGVVLNERGRVLKQNYNESNATNFDNKYEPGLYVCGWLGTGPIGVILTTMSNSFGVAETVCRDMEQGVITSTIKSGLDFSKYKETVSWKQWQKINQNEVECGAQKGKPREKILQISKMLQIAK